MNYTPKPNEFHLYKTGNNGDVEVEINDKEFTAPDEKGTYYFSYSVEWLDDENESISHGSATYAFSIEVE